MKRLTQLSLIAGDILKVWRGPTFIVEKLANCQTISHMQREKRFFYLFRFECQITETIFQFFDGFSFQHVGSNLAAVTTTKAARQT